MSGPLRVRVNELNPHLVCVLCGGYYIDATTIIECFHSFCRTCIVRYLESSKFCPICDVQVHKTRPLLNIRPDRTLQDLVYKLVPGLFTREMKSRRDFYLQQVTSGSRDDVSEADDDDDESDSSWGSQPPGPPRPRLQTVEAEQISVALEFSPDGKPVVHKNISKNSDSLMEKRYLLCPAVFTVRLLKKFIRMKFDLGPRLYIEIFYAEEPLSDQHTLLEITYIYTWKRTGPLRLYYCIFQSAPRRKRVASIGLTQIRGAESSHQTTTEPTTSQIEKLPELFPEEGARKNDTRKSSKKESRQTCDDHAASDNREASTSQRSDDHSGSTSQRSDDRAGSAAKRCDDPAGSTSSQHTQSASDPAPEPQLPEDPVCKMECVEPVTSKKKKRKKSKAKRPSPLSSVEYSGSGKKRRSSGSSSDTIPFCGPLDIEDVESAGELPQDPQEGHTTPASSHSTSSGSNGCKISTSSSGKSIVVSIPKHLIGSSADMEKKVSKKSHKHRHHPKARKHKRSSEKKHKRSSKKRRDKESGGECSNVADHDEAKDLAVGELSVPHIEEQGGCSSALHQTVYRDKKLCGTETDLKSRGSSDLEEVNSNDALVSRATLSSEVDDRTEKDSPTHITEGSPESSKQQVTSIGDGSPKSTSTTVDCVNEECKTKSTMPVNGRNYLGSGTSTLHASESIPTLKRGKVSKECQMTVESKTRRRSTSDAHKNSATSKGPQKRRSTEDHCVTDIAKAHKPSFFDQFTNYLQKQKEIEKSPGSMGFRDKNVSVLNASPKNANKPLSQPNTSGQSDTELGDSIIPSAAKPKEGSCRIPITAKVPPALDSNVTFATARPHATSSKGSTLTDKEKAFQKAGRVNRLLDQLSKKKKRQVEREAGSSQKHSCEPSQPTDTLLSDDPPGTTSAVPVKVDTEDNRVRNGDQEAGVAGLSDLNDHEVISIHITNEPDTKSPVGDDRGVSPSETCTGPLNRTTAASDKEIESVVVSTEAPVAPTTVQNPSIGTFQSPVKVKDFLAVRRCSDTSNDMKKGSQQFLVPKNILGPTLMPGTHVLKGEALSSGITILKPMSSSPPKESEVNVAPPRKFFKHPRQQPGLPLSKQEKKGNVKTLSTTHRSTGRYAGSKTGQLSGKRSPTKCLESGTATKSPSLGAHGLNLTATGNEDGRNMKEKACEAASIYTYPVSVDEPDSNSKPRQESKSSNSVSKMQNGGDQGSDSTSLSETVEQDTTANILSQTNTTDLPESTNPKREADGELFKENRREQAYKPVDICQVEADSSPYRVNHCEAHGHTCNLNGSLSPARSPQNNNMPCSSLSPRGLSTGDNTCTECHASAPSTSQETRTRPKKIGDKTESNLDEGSTCASQTSILSGGQPGITG